MVVTISKGGYYALRCLQAMPEPIFPYLPSVRPLCPIPVISHHTTAKTPKDGILRENSREGIGKNERSLVERMKINGEFTTFGQQNNDGHHAF